MRISDWSSDVAGMQLHAGLVMLGVCAIASHAHVAGGHALYGTAVGVQDFGGCEAGKQVYAQGFGLLAHPANDIAQLRSEEHTSELQSLMRISYAVFCLKKKNKNTASR